MVTYATQHWVTLGIFGKTAMEKDYYTVKEFAELLGYSTDRVYEWLRSGYIESLEKPSPHSIWRIPITELARLKNTPAKVTKLSINRVQEEHVEHIRLLLLDWRRDIRLKNVTKAGVTAPAFPIEGEEMFPFVIEHCPSIKGIYEEYKNFDMASFWGSGISVPNLWAIAEVAFTSYGLKIKPELYVDILWNITRQIEIDQTIHFKPLNVEGLSNPDQASCHKAQQEIFSLVELDEDEHKKRKMISYYKHLIEELDRAIETSLNSHEYLKNRCNWCPA